MDMNAFWKKIKPSLKIFGKVTWKLTLIGIIVAVAAGFGAAGVGTGMAVGALKDVPDINPEVLENPFLPSYVYDINGDLITKIDDGQNRIQVSFDDLPKDLINAFLAAEDNNFWEHPGVDLRSIARAIYNNLVSSTGEGASTITQQVVKQEFLTSEKQMSRKLQEAYIALALERQFTKEELFEFYINNATFYDNRAWGVEAAAQTYFSKSVSELTLAESALLAGIPNSPVYFSPDPDDMEPSYKRRNDVLNRMLRFGYITDEQAEEAKEEEIVLNPPERGSWPYPHYTDAVVHNYAVKALMETGRYETEGEAELAIRRDGLHIHTALDPRVQNVVQDVMFDDKYYPRDTFVYPEGHSRAGRRYPQGAALVMDAKNGHVYGMVGGREFNSTNKVNRYNSMFQPGSAIKPVLVYGPAFEAGVLSPASVLDDSPTAWPSNNGYYTPNNVNRTFKGLVTVRNAVAVSDNIPAIKAYEKVMKEAGGRYAAEFAQKLGITDYGMRKSGYNNEYTQLGSAIGSHEVSPLEMTQAFSAFANKGISTEPIFVTKILDRTGTEIYSASPKQEVAMSEQTAFLMTDVLRSVVTSGTASPARLSNYHVAAKTGTTNDAHDRWTVGYSADYVFTAWLGNDNHVATIDDNTIKIPGTSAAGYNRINDMFGAIVRGTIGDNDVPFPSRPSGLTRVTVCAKSGLLPSEDCTDTVTDWFKSSAVPKKTCDMHIRVEVCSASGLLPGPNCPAELIEERVFLDRPEVEPTDSRWNGPVGRLPRDYDLRPPEETCPIHETPLEFSLQGTTLRWNWNQVEESDFVGFNIYHTVLGQAEKLNKKPLSIGTRKFSIPTPVPGIANEYRLVLVDEDDKETRHHQPITHIPNLGISFNANPQGNGVVLSWNAPSLGNSDVSLQGYNIYRNDQLIHTAEAKDTQFPDTGTNLGEGTYKYKLTALYRLKGEDAESAGVTVEITLEDQGGGDDDDDDNGDDENDDGENGNEGNDGNPGGDD